MNVMKNTSRITLLLVFLFVCILAGCTNSGQQQPPQGQGAGKEEKKPDKLKEIEANVDAMIGMLSGVENEPAKQQQQQKEQQQQQQQQQGGGQQNAQIGKPEDKGLLEPKPEVNWPVALKDVEKIHVQWNDYISQAAKDGVSKNNIDGFSNSLNEFTNEISLKNRTAALLAANSLNLHLSNFWMVYDSEVPPDLKRLKYYIRNVIYYSDMSEWVKTEENMNRSKNIFQSIRTTASKEKQEQINKIDFAIQELEKVVKQRNAPLIKLKGKLAVDNLVDFEKNMK